MPYGASITHGYLSSDGNGYRDHLRTQIIDAGNDVDMVGNNPEGIMTDNENEGWPGLVIDEVHSKGDVAIPAYKPNLVLINVGTNDCVQDIDIANAGGRISSMIDAIYSQSSAATVVLSTLLPNGDTTVEPRVLEVNEQYKSVVSEKQAAGQRIVLADFHGEGGLTLDDIQDGTHPTDAGYAKMAPIWFNAISDADSRGFIQVAE
jgi:lysophospholipase L1-like esterase